MIELIVFIVAVVLVMPLIGVRLWSPGGPRRKARRASVPVMWRREKWIVRSQYVVVLAQFVFIYGMLRYWLVQPMWVFWLGAVPISFTVALLLIHRACRIRWRRKALAADNELCPNCGYVLRGLPPKHACPECGKTYDLIEVKRGWIRAMKE